MEIRKQIKIGGGGQVEGEREREKMSEGIEGHEDREKGRWKGKSERSIILLDIIASLTPSVLLLILLLFPHHALLALTACRGHRGGKRHVGTW